MDSIKPVKTTPSPAALRAETGLTQQALATKMGVTLRTVQGWEQGDSPCSGPSLQLLQLMAGKHGQYFLTAKKRNYL